MKTWFITGTSREFGRARTDAALERGDRVAATARNQVVTRFLAPVPLAVLSSTVR